VVLSKFNADLAVFDQPFRYH